PVGDTTVTCSATDAHGNTAAGHFTVNVRALLSIEVKTLDDQDHAAIDAGQTIPFKATGFFSDGSVASTADSDAGGSGGSGSGGGSGGGGSQSGSWWSIHFFQCLNTSVCGTMSTGGAFTSQNFNIDSTGNVHTVWSPFTP